ncbi:MAG: hypothetical protein ACYC5G_04385 [Candidatus Doudnabacteria bacterium]
MKTISEASNNWDYLSFDAGAEFIQQWISIEEEIPSTSNKYINRDVILNLLSGKFKYQKIGFYTDGSKSFENYDGEIEFLKSGWYCEELQFDSGDVEFIDFSSSVIGWRPIEFK